ncbi:MAG: aminotransferase class V-fold PLP-dependent enzyme [Leptospiraceae bacterium]|nr:aminotransferase class V-fold PLP-dependent enzyme [Leptospiraceae bacterium]
MKIYLDFNSTHPPIAEVLAAARAFYLENFANSSGLSLFSQKTNARIEAARERIANLLGVSATQVVFTSSATEANNLLIRELRRQHRGETFRILSSPFEHPSVAEALKTLEDSEIVFFSATNCFDPHSALATLVSPHLLVAMAVQNETGIILPALEFARTKAASTAMLCDAAQLFPKLCRDGPPALQPHIVRQLTDAGAFVTAAGHKLGAGFGCGLLLTPRAHSLRAEHPLLAGGNQEFGLRSGSHNTEAIVALELALEHKLHSNRYVLWQKTTQLLEDTLREELSFLDGLRIVGSGMERAPGTTLLLLPEVPIDFLILALDRAGITVSTGTSCKSRSRTPSAALLALGFSEKEALSVIRLSYDQNLTGEQIRYVAKTIASSVRALVR